MRPIPDNLQTLFKTRKRLVRVWLKIEQNTPYSQMAANLERARGQTWNRGVLG